jgi:GTPase SAR1 family protein
MMNLLIDKEIDLNEKDLLHTKPYAKSLKELILNAPQNTPMTIGLFGEWGSGKSSIIKTLTTELEQEKSLRVQFVVYDAWKYANDSFRRMFLLKVQNALGLEQTKKMTSFYMNKNTEVDIKRTFNLPYLTLTVIGMLLVLAMYTLFKTPGSGTITLAIILSMLGFLTNVFSKAFNEYKVTSQQPYFFAPEQFEECFNEIVGKALKKKTGIEKMANFIKGKEDGDIDKLVIVIDNIDRCHKETAYELLTNTKNFIDTRLDVIFLIPVDDNALKKHIFKGEAQGLKQSEEFLRKYFNVTVRIKPYKVTEIFDFASQINNQNKLGFKPDTINIIAKEYASNPRRIIQFYNNLQLELILLEDKYGKKFIEENEIAICKFLIIREEWHSHYMVLCQNPEAFLTDSYHSSKDNDPDGYATFLDATYVSTRTLNFDTLQKILVNSDNYDVLPDKILTVIQNKEFTTFDETLNETGYTKERVIDFFLFSLNKAIKNKLITTDVPNILDQIYTFMVYATELNESYFGRLENELRKNLPTHVSNAKNMVNLVAFSNHALERKLSFMDRGIVSALNDFSVEEGKFYDSPQFELYQAYYRAAGTDQLMLAAKSFPNYLNNKKLTDKLDRELSDGQLDLLYTDIIIHNYLVNGEQQIWDDDNSKAQWLYLAGHLTEQNQLLFPLLNFAQLSINTTPDSEWQIIQTLEPIFALSLNVRYDQRILDEVINLNQTLFSSKRLPGIGIQKYLHNLPEGTLEETVSYLFESYRLTDGHQDAVNWISELIAHYGEGAVKAKVVSMIDKYPELATEPLKSVINAFALINVETNNILLKTLYRHKNTPDYTDNELKTHLSRILDQVKTNAEHDPLLLAHLSQERADKIVADLLFEMSEAEFKRLSSAIQAVAFDLMTDKNNISRFKSNYDMLQIIALNGEEKHINGLVNTIKSNLLDQQQTKNTLQLILSLSKISKANAVDLITYIQSNKVADLGYKKETEAVVKKLKTI